MNNDLALGRLIAGVMIRVSLAIAFLGGSADVAADLPTYITVDRHWAAARRLIDQKDYLGALEALDKLRCLQDRDNVNLPDSFQIKVAEAALSAGKFRRAEKAVATYLQESSRLGEHYDQALKLLDDVERAIPEMMPIASGQFWMGCDSENECEDNEKPLRCVKVGSFEISKYEVTFEQYDRFVSATGYARPGDNGWGRGRRPVIRVSWDDAVAYTRWLSSATGDDYRLPSEAEWEFAACLCKTRTQACSDSTSRSKVNQICRDDTTRSGPFVPTNPARTAPVGSFKPNGWGLYDLAGNVSEWVQDCWNRTYEGAPTNGTAWLKGDCSRRVVRGGWWNDTWSPFRPQKRIRKTSGYRNSDLGFRVVRKVNPESE